MSSVTLKQLAQQLGLASSTVSRALRNGSDISPDTRQRVQALAAQLHYQPHAYASGLRNQMSHTIGIILPEVNNHFFSQAIDGIEEIARQNGYHVLIYLTHDRYAQEIAATRHLTRGRVDGILVSLASETQQVGHFEQLCQQGLPVVLFDRVSDALRTATVTTNDWGGAYQATEHLLGLGCRRIAYLRIAGHLAIGQQRQQGYAAALHAHGLAPDPDLVLEGSPTSDDDQHRIRELLSRRPDIDGVFASTERLAISCYQACRALGRPIPQQLKVISFSSLEIVSLLSPALTTITQPAYAIGREAARILFQAITTKTPALPSQSLELKAELCVRESTVGEPALAAPALQEATA